MTCWPSSSFRSWCRVAPRPPTSMPSLPRSTSACSRAPTPRRWCGSSSPSGRLPARRWQGWRATWCRGPSARRPGPRRSRAWTGTSAPGPWMRRGRRGPRQPCSSSRAAVSGPPCGSCSSSRGSRRRRLAGGSGGAGADEVAASLGRIKTGVKFGSGAATQLDWLKEGFDALPPDSSVTRAKGALKELTRMYNLLATVAAEPDRLIGNARYEAAFQHFAERTASLPQVQGWIAADGDEVRRTTAEMVARRDTISLLRKGVEQRFGRPFERMLQECTPNLECFSGFADYKVRIEQQQYHIAHLLDERSANLVEQRALCWRVGQRGWSNPACPETVNRKG